MVGGGSEVSGISRLGIARNTQARFSAIFVNNGRCFRMGGIAGRAAENPHGSPYARVVDEAFLL